MSWVVVVSGKVKIDRKQSMEYIYQICVLEEGFSWQCYQED